MKKSLVIIASALLLAVGAGSNRLRYDSGVFASGDGVTGAARRGPDEYPPCVRGVREDRCIQLYEPGVRQSYRRWLAERGRAGAAVPRRTARAYPVCRNRSDDHCVQAPAHTARGGQRARSAAARQAHPARPAAVRPAAVRAAARQPVRAAPQRRAMRAVARPVQVRPRPVQARPVQGRPAPARPAPARRPAPQPALPAGANTPGI